MTNKQIQVFQLIQSQWAVEIATRYAMVTASRDGEDSKGRAQYELLPPELVALRAVAIADALYRQLKARGFLYEEFPDNTA